MTKFSHYSSLYLEFKEHELKPSTFSKYEGIVRLRLDYFNRFDITEIKPSHIKKWLYSFDDVGSKSKRHYLSVLSGILQEALFDEVIEKNPCKMIRQPKYYKPTIKPFSPGEVHLIMENCPDHNFKYYVAIAFYTGMRSGEIIGLKKTDIDFDKRTIKVQRTRSRFGETSPKTTYSIREVPIIDLLMPYITELYLSHDEDYLFITRYNEPYKDTKTFINKFWKPLIKTLNLEYRRPYNTRHTFATNMLYNNLVTPIQLSQILGHANVQMVYDVYVSYIENKYSDFDRTISIYG